MYKRVGRRIPPPNYSGVVFSPVAVSDLSVGYNGGRKSPPPGRIPLYPSNTLYITEGQRGAVAGADPWAFSPASSSMSHNVYTKPESTVNESESVSDEKYVTAERPLELPISDMDPISDIDNEPYPEEEKSTQSGSSSIIDKLLSMNIKIEDIIMLGILLLALTDKADNDIMLIMGLLMMVT